ncbi:hypothetical protein Lupro_06100 [Lutibacter profundi]|uniref:DUF3857 domain-containing protein n=1 Tax=Lutibacter profundi TaxID=1622118 RepID=A0A120IE81_9FLAO|nr:DUF3857 domain-containing protein [Lutibacter profundi]AMC10839.1 hypothetical protein Lupro_06100 [Lutibacter profundi]
MKKSLLFTLVVILILNKPKAQNFNFGEISKEELREQYYPNDSTANAAYLYKERKIHYTYDGERGWTLVTEVYERIKLYNKEGFDYATKVIGLYKDGPSEKMTSLKANTYNLENNKIVKEKLAKNQLFKENKTKNTIVYKFTMPNIKKGAIVEWKYKIYSPYYSYIDEIELQHKIPIKQLNVEVKIPEYFKFKRHLKGYLPVHVVQSMNNRTIQFSYRRQVDSRRISTVRETNEVDLREIIYTVRDKNIPALEEENYISNIENYRSALSLELSYTEFPGSRVKNYSSTWESVCNKINKSSVFGLELSKKAYFKEDLTPIIATTSDKLKRINLILEFVKSKVKWNGTYGKYTDVGVKKAYKEGIGNVAEINLILVSMLREGGLNANPVLVSTRNHGVPLFPTSKGFNYVISAVEINEEIILLDASEEYSMPNVLPYRVINWRGRLVKEDGTSLWVDLIPAKHAVDNKNTNISIDSEGYVEGMQRTNHMNMQALSYRKKYAKIKDETIIEKLEKENEAIEIADFRIINKTGGNKPVVEMFKFSSEDLIELVGDRMYFKPLFFNSQTKNPFQLDKREYPIDFGTPFIEKNMVRITIPEGYIIESVPESIAIGLPNDYGVYIFNVKTQGNIMMIMSKLKMNTAIYPVLNYDEIKEFYKIIVSKNLEQVVLKKV